MTKIINESLKHLDMDGQVFPIVGIDQYASAVGQDDDLITLNFIVKTKAVASDLSAWFEKGYDWVIDAEISPGEVTDGKFYVFVEINRKNKSPDQIIEMLDDLETLTGFKNNEWKLKIGDELFPSTADIIRSKIQLSPHEYRMAKEEPLNEWRQIAGIQTTNTYNNDEEMKAIKRRAGIY